MQNSRSPAAAAILYNIWAPTKNRPLLGGIEAPSDELFSKLTYVYIKYIDIYLKCEMNVLTCVFHGGFK